MSMIEDGLKQVVTRLKAAGVSRLRKLWADGGYQGEAVRTWVADLKKTHKIDLEVVAKQGPGFVVLPPPVGSSSAPWRG